MTRRVRFSPLLAAGVFAGALSAPSARASNVPLVPQPLQPGGDVNPRIAAVDLDQVHAVMGPNGSGKSTLAYALMGHPAYRITEGEILFDGDNLVELEADERAQRGLFLAFQYPHAVPGVTVTNFLRSSINALRKARAGQDDPIPIPEFRKELLARMEELKVSRELAQRYINDYVRQNFRIVQLDMFGSREVTDFDGTKLSEKALAERWGVIFTPTIVFYKDDLAGLDGKWGRELEAIERLPRVLLRVQPPCLVDLCGRRRDVGARDPGQERQHHRHHDQHLDQGEAAFRSRRQALPDPLQRGTSALPDHRLTIGTDPARR